MNTAHLIFDRVKTLPDVQAQEVLDFTNFIMMQHNHKKTFQQEGLVELILAMPEIEDSQVFDRIQNGKVTIHTAIV